VRGRVAVNGGMGGRSRAERVETIEVRVEAGMGSMLLRCLIPRILEALSVRWLSERAFGTEPEGVDTVM
jgi:hypothetical protein